MVNIYGEYIHTPHIYVYKYIYELSPYIYHLYVCMYVYIWNTPKKFLRG